MSSISTTSSFTCPETADMKASSDDTLYEDKAGLAEKLRNVIKDYWNKEVPSYKKGDPNHKKHDDMFCGYHLVVIDTVRTKDGFYFAFVQEIANPTNDIDSRLKRLSKLQIQVDDAGKLKITGYISRYGDFFEKIFDEFINIDKLLEKDVNDEAETYPAMKRMYRNFLDSSTNAMLPK